MKFIQILWAKLQISVKCKDKNLKLINLHSLEIVSEFVHKIKVNQFNVTSSKSPHEKVVLDEIEFDLNPSHVGTTDNFPQKITWG